MRTILRNLVVWNYNLVNYELTHRPILVPEPMQPTLFILPNSLQILANPSNVALLRQPPAPANARAQPLHQPSMVQRFPHLLASHPLPLPPLPSSGLLPRSSASVVAAAED